MPWIASLLAVDLKGSCAFASKSAAQLLGYQPYELIGKDIRELLPSSSNRDWVYAEQERTSPDTVQPDAGVLMTTERLARRDATQVAVELSRAPLIMGEQLSEQ